MAGQPIAKITAGGGTHVIAPSFYATCDTAAATAAKIAKLVDTNVNAATFITGMALWVKFTNANGIANPTLAVQTSGGTEILAAKSIMGYGTTAVSTSAKTSWHAGAIVCFVYDGTNWVETTGLDSNTTYTAATAAPAVIPSSTASVTGTSTHYAREDHTHGLSKAAVTSALGYTPPTTNTTYSVVTTAANGLMAATDKVKLNKITFTVTAAIGHDASDKRIILATSAL